MSECKAMNCWFRLLDGCPVMWRHFCLHTAGKFTKRRRTFGLRPIIPDESQSERKYEIELGGGSASVVWSVSMSVVKATAREQIYSSDVGQCHSADAADYQYQLSASSID